MKSKLTDWAWIDKRDGSLHISARDMLREMGVADTPENREQCQRMAVEILCEMLKDQPAVIHTTE